jgi:hypothetical protein
VQRSRAGVLYFPFSPDFDLLHQTHTARVQRVNPALEPGYFLSGHARSPAAVLGSPLQLMAQGKAARCRQQPAAAIIAALAAGERSDNQ